MVEVIVPAESKLIGQTVLEARIRSDYGLTVIGLRRGQSVHGHGLLEEKLKVGDTLLLVGFWKDIERLPERRQTIWSSSARRSSWTRSCRPPARRPMRSPSWRWWSG